jgi:hypothetical protein
MYWLHVVHLEVEVERVEEGREDAYPRNKTPAEVGLLPAPDGKTLCYIAQRLLPDPSLR